MSPPQSLGRSRHQAKVGGAHPTRLLNVALCPRKHVDLLVEQNGIGFLMGKERWWVFIDGILWVKRIRADVWTVAHHNGVVINIPVSAITDEQVEHLQAGARRGVEYLRELATKQPK